MRENPDAASVKQLELAFDSLVVAPTPSHSIANNVVHVKFGLQKSPQLSGSSKDQAIIDSILESAQRLKW